MCLLWYVLITFVQTIYFDDIQRQQVNNPARALYFHYKIFAAVWYTSNFPYALAMQMYRHKVHKEQSFILVGILRFALSKISTDNVLIYM